MDATTKPVLLPCPFCGCTNIFIEPDERGSGGQWVGPIHVGCIECKVEQLGDDKEEAIAAWNRRIAAEAPAPSEPVKPAEPLNLTNDEAYSYLSGYEDALNSAAVYVSDHLMHGEEHVDVILNLARPEITTRDATASLSLPMGWKPMPTVMTPAMREAWEKAPSSEDSEEEIRCLYSALLDAAPAAPLSQPSIPEHEDTKRLNFMIHSGASVAHSMDREVCNVWLPAERDGTEARPAEGYPQKCYDDPRKAIDAARLAALPAAQLPPDYEQIAKDAEAKRQSYRDLNAMISAQLPPQT